MATMRKQIVSKAFTQNSHSPSKFQKSTVKSRSPSPKIPELEDYISAVCECIENNKRLPVELLNQARSMSKMLERSLPYYPDFSYDFYLTVKDFLKSITETKTKDYSSLTVHLIKISEFMQQSQETPKLGPIDILAASISLLDITEIAASLENAEPFKTICLVFLKVFSSVDDSIPANCLHFASKAVNFMKVYLGSPETALTHIKSAQRYLDEDEIYIGECYVENIDSTIRKIGRCKCTGNLKKIKHFLEAVLETYSEIKTKESFSTAKQSLSASFESSLKEEEQILNLRTEVICGQNADTFDDQQKKTFLNKLKPRNCSREPACPNIASFEEKKNTNDYKFRLNNISGRKPELIGSTSWRELQIQKERAKLNANMSKYTRK